MKCEDCKFWRKDKENSPMGTIGTCSAVKMYWDSIRWDEEGDKVVVKEEYKNNKFFVQDGSDYRAWL